jgi:hypothetical protein
MDQLAPSKVPVYEGRTQARQLWQRHADRGEPVVAIRDARRGYIVRYDIAHLDRALSPDALQRLRERVRRHRTYPTGTDPISESEGVGGEAGPVSGDLHAPTEAEARRLASAVSAFVFDAAPPAGAT